ncbi:MAG: carboxypeptidase regulatory-like domain-containing protein [Bacteroidales bacterium]|nr:carboxypeptidase regulatory-like domain-containing protein [Bacteroidales bacterium]
MNKTLLRLLCVSIIVCFQLSAFNLLHAQESAFNANHQKMALLPGEVTGVSIVDDNLYCYASSVLLVAQRSGEQLLGFWADTQYVRLAEGINYLVRHPSTGDLYFTCPDKSGRSILYCYHQPEGKKGRLRKVRMSGLTVEHPTFTADGHIMIFSSPERRRSFGGYDLWYSLLENGKWSRPTNLGNRINTSYDEISPSVYRDCLLFSSNGHDGDHSYLNIYSTRLISDHAIGDTVGMLQIGRCRVQKLPEPLNSDDADDIDMAIDTAHGCGYWVSKRVESDSDSQLYSFSGTLDGVLLWGRTKDKYDYPLAGVRVTALQNGLPVCNTITDTDGFYRLYLQCDQYYELTYQLPGYFIAFDEINTTKEDGEYLISETTLDVTMDNLVIGERIFYDDLFGPGVDLELSEQGREKLAPLLRFLSDNPHMHVDVSLSNDITNDPSFNGLLTTHRLQTIERYLYAQLPSSVTLSTNNACSGQSGCNTATGLSRLAVVITEE